MIRGVLSNRLRENSRFTASLPIQNLLGAISVFLKFEMSVIQCRTTLFDMYPWTRSLPFESCAKVVPEPVLHKLSARRICAKQLHARNW